MSTVNFNMRVEKELKDETSQIFENYGMTTAQAVRMFWSMLPKRRKFRCRLIIKQMIWYSVLRRYRRLSRGV